MEQQFVNQDINLFNGHQAAAISADGRGHAGTTSLKEALERVKGESKEHQASGRKVKGWAEHQWEGF